MRRIFTLLIIYKLTNFCSAQNLSDIHLHSNGLIYSDQVIKNIREMVNNFNEEFKVTPLHKSYQSKTQAIGHYFAIKGTKAYQVVKDLEQNLSFNKLLLKYPEMQIERNLFVLKYSYHIESDKVVDEYGSCSMHPRATLQHLTINENKQTYEDSPYVYQTSMGDPFIHGFYLLNEPTQYQLPEKYARMVQYANSIIDTNSLVMKEEAWMAKEQMKVIDSTQVGKFLSYVNHSALVSKRDHGEVFHASLNSAIHEALNENISNEEFERYVSIYDAKELALELKRRRVVMGTNAEDLRPLIHALQLAILAGETANMEIFFRAHFNVMNGYFPGGNPLSQILWGRRTLVKELEEMHLEVESLILGTLFQVEPTAPHHYFSMIDQMALALAEYSKAESVEKIMTDIMREEHIDDYNKWMMYQLYGQYLKHTKELERKRAILDRFMTAIYELPWYMHQKIQISHWTR